jgi:hypothetical protein
VADVYRESRRRARKAMVTQTLRPVLDCRTPAELAGWAMERAERMGLANDWMLVCEDQAGQMHFLVPLWAGWVVMLGWAVELVPVGGSAVEPQVAIKGKGTQR